MALPVTLSPEARRYFLKIYYSETGKLTGAENKAFGPITTEHFDHDIIQNTRDNVNDSRRNVLDVEILDALKAVRGKEWDGLCGREACMEPGAKWYNRGSRWYYCGSCARVLNIANRNEPGGPLCTHQPTKPE